MKGTIRLIGTVTLAVALVAGTLLSVSMLNSGDGVRAGAVPGSTPAGGMEDRNGPGDNGGQQPAVVRAETGPGPTPDSGGGLLVQAPGAPRHLTASWVEGSVVLVWQAPAEGEASHYTVTRTHWNQGAQVKWDTVVVPLTSYRDDDVEAGVTHLHGQQPRQRPGEPSGGGDGHHWRDHP